MSAEPLTLDNYPLSEVTIGSSVLMINHYGAAKATFCAVNCKLQPRLHHSLSEVDWLIENSVSENTRKAHASDIHHFQTWGGSIPATPKMVATYLAFHGSTLSVATIARRVATISWAHDLQNLPNPCRSEIVRRAFRGLKRLKGTAQRAAKPLLREELFLTLDAMGSEPRDIRDRALLLLGFAGGLRRSELVGFDYSDLEFVRHGIIITLRRSKTDQESASRKIGIPLGRTRYCPVAAIEAWLALLGIKGGALFRPIDRYGRIRSSRLSGEAVSSIVRERTAAAGIDPDGFSGHSLRAGFATSAAQAGVPTDKIKAQTGHASDAMLARYIREGDLFIRNAAGALL